VGGGGGGREKEKDWSHFTGQTGASRWDLLAAGCQNHAGERPGGAYAIGDSKGGLLGPKKSVGGRHESGCTGGEGLLRGPGGTTRGAPIANGKKNIQIYRAKKQK